MDLATRPSGLGLAPGPGETIAQIGVGSAEYPGRFPPSEFGLFGGMGAMDSRNRALWIECAGSVLGPNASTAVGRKQVGDFPRLTLNLLMKEVMGSEGKMTTSYGALCSR